MKKEVCSECKLVFADYDRRVQVMVDGKLCIFHPACLDRKRLNITKQKSQEEVSGSRMSRERKRR